MKLITTIILATVTILISFKAFKAKFSGKANSKYCGDDLGFE
jgi:hypothetical protein